MKIIVRFTDGDNQRFEGVSRHIVDNGMLKLYFKSGSVRFIQMTRIKYFDSFEEANPYLDKDTIIDPGSGNWECKPFWCTDSISNHTLPTDDLPKYESLSKEEFERMYVGTWDVQEHDMNTPENLEKYGSHTKHYGD